MSPAYKTPEQRDRWHKRTCARRDRHGWFAARWPDGHVCRTCHDKALRVQDPCPACGDERVLPGLRPDDGALICPDCAGFMMSYRCSRCGQEGKLHGGRLCTRCTLTDRLGELLDDGTGRIRPALLPLAKSLLNADNPVSILNGLHMRKGKIGAPDDLMRRLGRGEIELTHEAFHTLQPWRAAAHLRELLMACGVLPAVDKQLCLFESWLVGHLAVIAEPEPAQIIRRFATWSVLPKLRTAADRRPLTPGSQKYATGQVKHATAFLNWLSDHDLTLTACRQTDIDRWHVEHKEHNRSTVRPFLLWCQTIKLTRRFRLPPPQARRAAPLSHSDRLSFLGRLLTDDSLPPRSRVAAVIILLYAQPCSRVVRPTIDDVIHDNGQVLLRLGEPFSPVPAPFAELLLTWIDNRDNMNTATNPDSRWLFPGRRAGQPLHPNGLSSQLNDLGIPTTAARAAAIRQQVLEMPAPVVADALGYHNKTTTRLRNETGGTWSRYASGDHTRSPPGWVPRGTGDS